MNTPSADSSASSFDAEPSEAIEAILGFQGPVLIDLDETLYLRNSTEDFIDTARPGLLAMILLRALDLLKPWRLTGGEPTRDAWRVRIIAIFFPWVKMRWRRRTAELAARHVNRPLLDALKSSAARPIVVTVGFLHIVHPLIASLGLADVTVVAARGFGFRDRLRGKLAMAVDALGIDTVRSALVITDSIQDEPLLKTSARPLRTIWPGARYHRALGRVYVPGEYLSRVKRPGEHYIWRGIIQEDFAFWVLSSISLAAYPILHVLGLLLLLLSFWAIYEHGYVDNDYTAANFEHDPKLTAEFYEAPVSTPKWQPWIWAIASGCAALFVLRAPHRPVPLDFFKWFAVLVATYGWFWLYNRMDKDTRIWMFPFLQFARCAAFAAVVPVVAVGATALGAHVFSRWVPYYVYRYGTQGWPNAKTYLIRVLFFVLLSALLIISQGPIAVFNMTGAVILLWSLFKARHELADVARNVSRLDRGTPRR